MISREEEERPPEERPAEEPLAPEDETVTAHPDPAEPAGEEDPGNEAEIEEATERPERFGEGPGPSSDAALASDGDGPEEPLARAERERDEYLDLARRTQASFENYRKRANRETAAAGERARGKLIGELLPVVDNLERALGSAGEGEQHLAEGVRLVHADLVAVLERNGIESFDPSGERFDPALHEALSMRSEEGSESGLVLDVVEKGYKVNGSVLRPARVVVSG
jgi:molecular chaperone GrpE